MTPEDSFARGIAVVTAMLEARERAGNTELTVEEIAAQFTEDGTLLNTVVGLAAVAMTLVQWREAEMEIPARDTLHQIALATQTNPDK